MSTLRAFFLVLAAVARRLSDAVVEDAFAAACDVDDHAIEDPATLRVVVEAPVHHMIQVTT